MYSLDAVGNILFGRTARLRVAKWVFLHEDPHFYQGEAAKGANTPQSNVIDELDRLVQLGMIRKMPRGPGQRRQYYTRLNSPLWEIVGVTVRVVDKGEDGTGGGRAAL
jgi:hypothetical protein